MYNRCDNIYIAVSFLYFKYMYDFNGRTFVHLEVLKKKNLCDVKIVSNYKTKHYLI